MVINGIMINRDHPASTAGMTMDILTVTKFFCISKIHQNLR